MRLRRRRRDMHFHPFARSVSCILVSMASLLTLSGGCTSDQMAAREAPREDRLASARPVRATTSPIDSRDPLVRTALAVPSGIVSTSVILVEKLGPREARLNRPYDYRIRVTNLTSNPLTGVVVRERLPETFSITRSEPAAKQDEGWVIYSIGELPPMGARTVDVT